MDEQRNTFVFYRSFHDAIKVAPKKHQLALFLALTEYAFENKTPQLDGTSLAVWNAIKPQIDSSMKRYENAKKGAEYGKRGAEYGKLGGRPKKEKTPKKGDTEKTPLRGINENPLDIDVYVEVDDDVYVDADKDVDVDNTPPNPLKGAAGESDTQPSLQEITDYCNERQNGIDPEEFYDFYTSKGWLIGKTPMKDWRACIRTWEKTRKKKNEPDRYADIDDWYRRRTTEDDQRGIFDNQPSDQSSVS